MVSTTSQDIADNKIRFAEVDYGQNELLCHSLGVHRFPSVHVYKLHVGKIADMVMTNESTSRSTTWKEEIREWSDMTPDALILEKMKQQQESQAFSMKHPSILSIDTPRQWEK